MLSSTAELHAARSETVQLHNDNIGEFIYDPISECTSAYRACCSPLPSPGWEEQRPSPSSSFRTFVFRLERSEGHTLQGSG